MIDAFGQKYCSSTTYSKIFNENLKTNEKIYKSN